ncbi:MAG: LysM peptidoglycan-binding domain-containing protein [Nannocystaceae bacterium]|nr:LysM peptidoglycan-binding domain-containing protein [Nannocystaceae bacterium]
MPTYTVKRGDCLSSIAFEHGFFWKTLYDHPKNESLRAHGKPFILEAGETVEVPALREKEVEAPTGRAHRFRRRGVPARFKVKLRYHDGEPRANEAYFFELDGELLDGERETDGDGNIDESIPPLARAVRVFLCDGEEVLAFSLGELDPASTVRGMKARLISLGFYGGAIDDSRSRAFEAALRRFSDAKGIDAAADESEVQAQLVQEHGS